VEQVDLLRRVVAVLEGMEVPYMLVGAYAAAAYGEPRLTYDIDIVVELRPEQALTLCAAFPPPEYYVSPEAAQEAVRARRQFNVIHPESGMKVAFILARTDAWGKTQMERRERTRILPDCEGYVARPEDVIVGKLLYYRQGGSEKHLRDITGILTTSGPEIDKAYIEHWAEKFDASDIWESILHRLDRES